MDEEGNFLATGNFNSGSEVGTTVNPPCPEEDPEEPTEDPDPGTPEWPQLPPEVTPDPPGQEQPPTPPGIPWELGSGSLNPPTLPPNPGGGGNPPVNPADPLGDPDITSPEFEELDEEAIKEGVEKALQGPSHLTGLFQSKLAELLKFQASSIGQVQAVQIGTFYGQALRFDLRPIAPAVATGRNFLKWALVLVFVLASARAIRQAVIS